MVYDKNILEIKTVDCFNNNHYNQCLNYLKVSKSKLAILANFNLTSLEYKRIIDSKNNLRICGHQKYELQISLK